MALPPGYKLGPNGEWVPVASTSTPAAAPTAVDSSSIIATLQSQIKNGQISVSDAKTKLIDSINASAGYLNTAEKVQAYQAAIAAAPAQLFANLGEIRTPDGSFATVSPQGDVMVNSTKTVSSNVGSQGTSTSQNVSGVTYDYNTGKPLAPGQAQSTYNTSTGQAIGSPSSTAAKYDTATGKPLATAAVTADQAMQDAMKTGITAEQYGRLSPSQQAIVSAAGAAAGVIASGQSSGLSLGAALSAAANDPTITSKYADALKIDSAAFQNNLKQLQVATSTASQTQQQAFEAERKALAESHAAAGTAYSGFRKQAEGNLAATESGIVTSSKASLQKSLSDASLAFESKYGSAATPTAFTNYSDPLASAGTTISGLKSDATPSSETIIAAPIGGIAGSDAAAKAADVNKLGYQNYLNAQLPTL